MTLDQDRHAEAQRQPLDTEAAIARYHRDFLLGRVLPPDDHLATLFDSLERSGMDARPGVGDGPAAAEAVRH